jgi:hypothetical protein
MKRKILFVILIIVAGTLGYIFTYLVFYSPGAREMPVSEQETLKDQTSPKELFAVVVENLPEARPQSGLSLADFMIETLAEGGVTRMLAFYQNQEASVIGPVRSARPYFVDLALGFGAAFVHSGGSKEGLERIEELKDVLKDINEFYQEKTFWRDEGREAPHNLFTSTELLGELSRQKGWEPPASQSGWKISSGFPFSEAPKAEEISINFSSEAFAVSYKYNPAANAYERFLAGKPDVDALTNQEINPKNVVVLDTTSRVIDEKLLSLDLAVTPSGKAAIFRDGKVIQARWKKDSPDAPLRLVDADGSDVFLAPGQVWIEMIDQYGTVNWK